MKSFYRLQCGLKGREKEMDKYFGICGANSQKDHGATDNRPSRHQHTKTLTPIKGLSQMKGNEVNMPFIHFFSSFFAFFLIFF